MITVSWGLVKDRCAVQFDPWKAEKEAYKNVTGKTLETTMPCLGLESFDFNDCEFEAEELRFYSSIVERLTDYCNNVILENEY